MTHSVQSHSEPGTLEGFYSSFSSSLSHYAKEFKENVNAVFVGGSLLALTHLVNQTPTVSSYLEFSAGALLGYATLQELSSHQWKDLNEYLSDHKISAKYQPLAAVFMATGALGLCCSLLFHPVCSSSLGYALLGVGLNHILEKLNQKELLSNESSNVLKKINVIFTGALSLQKPLFRAACSLIGGTVGMGFYRFEQMLTTKAIEKTSP